jgi:hypothetical protein
MWWLWLLFGGLAAAALVTLTIAAVRDWFAAQRTPASGCGELVRERLANGNYRVVGGVFDRRGIRTASASWEAQSLDGELQRSFGAGDRVHFTL